MSASDWDVVRAIANAISALAALVAIGFTFFTLRNERRQKQTERRARHYDELVYAHVLRDVSAFADESFRSLDEDRRRIASLANEQDMAHQDIVAASKHALEAWEPRYFAYKSRLNARIDAWGDPNLTAGAADLIEKLQDDLTKEMERTAGGSASTELGVILSGYARGMFELVAACHPATKVSLSWLARHLRRFSKSRPPAASG